MANQLAGWSLRTRLMVMLLSLLALICVVVGLVTQLALRNVLIGQIDNRLTAAGDRSSGAYGYLGGGPSPGEGGNGGPFPLGQPVGTLTARFAPGQAPSAKILGPAGQATDVSDDDYAALAALPIDHAAHTRSLAEGDYRLQARQMRDGDIIITGLPLSDVDSTLWWLSVVELCVITLGLMAAGFAGAVIVRRTLRPLNRVAATASRVSELPLDRGEVDMSVRVPEVDTDTRTEVGQVGSALNRMLGHVATALRARQASEMRVRQFVADASHELRTPLAAIRGYTELAGRSGAEIPPEVAYALRRVESEGVRMTALVEDLLLLARLDSGRPLERESVDLSQLVVDAVSDAHVAGPDHTWRLDLPEEPVTVLGDGPRLHQVLGNLLANARTHTPAGTTVQIGLSGGGDGATLVVADNGPGIPPALLPDVFDRFARADTSRSRAAGSTGLGLAIVAAVVEAHHGAVDVASRPGRTVFTVTLPYTNGADLSSTVEGQE
jgi:two-component system OmpR family sensor kinase